MSVPTCFTSITFNYLPKARVLAASVKRTHPDWKFVVCICDRLEDHLEFNIEEEPFDEVIWGEELQIDNIYSWMFKHSVVEICTAVKGQVAWELLDRGAGKVIYFDPDMAMFNDMTELSEILDEHPICLVPHQLEPETELDAIKDNEICSLKHGVFNLGFFAMNDSDEGKRFTAWWRDRLLEFCYADIANGLFTDQKWCDLAPAFFPNLHIWRHPGCDVASWNLSKRELGFDEHGTVTVNGEPLLFYHFSSFDSGMGEVMTSKYAKGNVVVFELLNWYGKQLDEYGQKDFGHASWFFNCYDNGEKISADARHLMRERVDLQEFFDDPFITKCENSYYEWLTRHGHQPVAG